MLIALSCWPQKLAIGKVPRGGFVPGIDWSHLAAEDVLGLAIWILMMLMTISLGVWFACSIVENFTKTWRRRHHSNYDALLRENERLRDSLVDAQEENEYLRELYRGLPPRRAAEERRQSAA